MNSIESAVKSVDMICKHFLLVGATLMCFYYRTVLSQGQVRIPQTRFSCQGRVSGYYADMDTGCQVYHMCDGLGRQFSYTCPNTTLFQQRMLVCDHWYMVNCSASEKDYRANLLIGQRDKPFVSDEEMHLRTPRPDILNVPPNSNYYEGLREAESKFPIHPGNSIQGVADSISNTNNNGLDSAKPNYRPPYSWSTGTSVNRPTNVNPNPGFTGPNVDFNGNLASAASQGPDPSYEPTPPNQDFTRNTGESTRPTKPTYTGSTPSQHLRPPNPPPTTERTDSTEYDLDIRMDERQDPVVQFINRFDPNAPDSFKTSMTKTEIINLNNHLPPGQSSAEEERTPRRYKNGESNLNSVSDRTKDIGSLSKNFVKPTQPTFPETRNRQSQIPVPVNVLLPPKTNYHAQPVTTMGPPIYYEWKWAVPALDLEPPKVGNISNVTSAISPQNISGRSPFRDVTRPTPTESDLKTSNTEYNISSYYVPDYVFPLDNAHPGYESDDAESSFQVKLGRKGRSGYGENPNCPQCHPAYLKPGTCEPCIVNR